MCTLFIYSKDILIDRRQRTHFLLGKARSKSSAISPNDSPRYVPSALRSFMVCRAKFRLAAFANSATCLRHSAALANSETEC